MHGDIEDLVNTLMESTAIHTVRGIHHPKDTEAYLEAMRWCNHELFKLRFNIAPLRQMKQVIERIKEVAPSIRERRRFEIFTSYDLYYDLGIHHAEDIVNSIAIRFEDGYSSDDEVFITNLLERSKFK